MGEVLGEISAARQADPDRIAAARARGFAVIADEGRGHAAGRHAERLDGEGTDDQKERDEDATDMRSRTRQGER